MSDGKQRGQDAEAGCAERTGAMAGIEMIKRAVVFLRGMRGRVMMRAIGGTGLENGLDLVIAVDQAVEDRRQGIEEERDAGHRRAQPLCFEQSHPDAPAA